MSTGSITGIQGAKLVDYSATKRAIPALTKDSRQRRSRGHASRQQRAGHR
jgi:hypothetical protein